MIFESPTVTVLTVVAYVLIQQLEGNFLSLRIQGQALNLHPIIVLLAVIGGEQIGGLAGVVFAVPTLAVLRVFFDFFRTCLQTGPTEGDPGTPRAPLAGRLPLLDDLLQLALEGIDGLLRRNVALEGGVELLGHLERHVRVVGRDRARRGVLYDRLFA
jgi:hypothetical protein